MDQGIFCFYNEEIVFEPELRLSPFSPAFEYGAGFFTTLRAQDGNLYFLDDHLERLKKSVAESGYTFPEIPYKDTIQILLKTNYLRTSRVKIQVFDEGNPGLSVLIRTLPFSPLHDPVSLHLLETGTGVSFLSAHKSMNYFYHFLSRRNAVGLGAYDNLYVDSTGRLLETGTGNVFLYKNGQLVTPGLDQPILPGVFRKNLLNGFTRIPVSEETVYKTDLFNSCDGVIVTNSLQGAVAVQEIKYGDHSREYPRSKEIAQQINQALLPCLKEV